VALRPRLTAGVLFRFVLVALDPKETDRSQHTFARTYLRRYRLFVTAGTGPGMSLRRARWSLVWHRVRSGRAGTGSEGPVLSVSVAPGPRIGRRQLGQDDLAHVHDHHELAPLLAVIPVAEGFIQVPGDGVVTVDA
jgi:hypothetical protein